MLSTVNLYIFRNHRIVLNWFEQLRGGGAVVHSSELWCLRVAANCLSWVPEQGSVGASGDLAPLSHLALGLLGEGRMWSPETGWGEAKYVSFSLGIRNY